MSVREAERVARSIATDRVRKKELMQDPEVHEMESKLAEALGTRVHIEKKENGGKITIDFFTNDDLHSILSVVEHAEKKNPHEALNRFDAAQVEVSPVAETMEQAVGPVQDTMVDDRAVEEKEESDDDLYNIKNFSL